MARFYKSEPHWPFMQSGTEISFFSLLRPLCVKGSTAHGGMPRTSNGSLGLHRVEANAGTAQASPSSEPTVPRAELVTSKETHTSPHPKHYFRNARRSLSASKAFGRTLTRYVNLIMRVIPNLGRVPLHPTKPRLWYC